jgi:hypothetical protein
MSAMKAKGHGKGQLGPAHLVKRAGIEHQRVTLALAPVEYNAQQHAIVLVDAVGTWQEDGLAGGLSMDEESLGSARVRVLFEQAVEECRLSTVSSAVNVPARLGGIKRVEGWELEGDVDAGLKDDFDLFESRGRCQRHRVGADVAELEAGERGTSSVFVLAQKVPRAWQRAFQVLAVETLENVEVLVNGDLGDDVCLSGFCGRGFVPSVDGVEGKKGV